MLRTWEVGIEKTGAYLYSRLLLAIFSGVATFLVLTALGVPFAVPLAVWMGLVSQFIPTIGTYIAMALPLLVAVVQGPADALILLVFFTVYQQIENYLLSPRITARTMQLHPAVAFGCRDRGGQHLRDRRGVPRAPARRDRPGAGLDVHPSARRGGDRPHAGRDQR